MAIDLIEREGEMRNDDEKSTTTEVHDNFTRYILIPVKLCIALGIASIADMFFGNFNKFAFGAGLFLGTILQNHIAPKAKPVQFILLLVLALICAIIRPYLIGRHLF